MNEASAGAAAPALRPKPDRAGPGFTPAVSADVATGTGGVTTGLPSGINLPQADSKASAANAAK
jgi:hypothetical protein